ncbi:MAG TPA: replication-associated recombination protein A [Tepidisphaeraceae bacterium]|nr:replication-associated recombination protein A [Tepidisphaeraceae bacterium]
MDLFRDVRQKNLDRVAPLAVRMRPRTLDEFVGQEHFLGSGKLLRRMLEADRLTSVIFYGPPGTGKTTLAQLIAAYTKSHFEQVNAAAVGVKEVRKILDDAKDRLGNSGQRTVLFLDEIHRFNRAQQDILLPDVEAGLVLLVGATTENPFFAVNSPLISRSQIFQFAPISEDDIRKLIRRAIADEERGFGKLPIKIDDEAIDLWATKSDGDARRALMALEVAVLSMREEGTKARRHEGTEGESETASDPLRASVPDAFVPSPLHITLDVAEQSIQRKAIVYDGTGDEHYDAASALIKSMRGSDPDAAVYWVARMLEAGEDPRFVARRIAILASEDVGNADPQAIVVAAAAFDIVEKIGMPEAQITLSQAAIYMATAPKSNASYVAINKAMEDVREGRTIPVPRHLRDTHYKGSSLLGHGKGYKYAHDFEGGVVEQDYLGVDKTYYVPTDRGYEKTISERLERIRSKRTNSGAGGVSSSMEGEGDRGRERAPDAADPSPPAPDAPGMPESGKMGKGRRRGGVEK